MSVHAELVEKAARWLASQGNAVVITDMASSAPETPDAIGWTGRFSTLIECKASRSDFLADASKPFRGSRGVDRAMGHWRYYLTPRGMVRPTELPVGWGLLEPAGGGLAVVVAAKANDEDRSYESALLCSALRRVIHSPGGVRGVRCRLYEIDGTGEPRATIAARRPDPVASPTPPREGETPCPTPTDPSAAPPPDAGALPSRTGRTRRRRLKRWRR